MPKRKRPTARQRKVIEQLPEIIAGKKTKKQALIDAGYSAKTADKGPEDVLGSDGVRGEVLKALKKHNITLDRISQKIEEGMDATREGDDDYAIRHKYVVTALELHDAFPSKKFDVTTHEPLTYDNLEGQTKAQTPEDARKRAEKAAE